MKTLSVLSIHSHKDLLRTCLPKSLEDWLKDNNIRYAHPHDCLVNINEVKDKRFGNLSKNIHIWLYKTAVRKYWDNLDDKLKKDESIIMFKKGTPAKTVSQEFRKASNKFAKEYLEKVSRTKYIGIY